MPIYINIYIYMCMWLLNRFLESASPPIFLKSDCSLSLSTTIFLANTLSRLFVSFIWLNLYLFLYFAVGLISCFESLKNAFWQVMRLWSLCHLATCLALLLLRILRSTRARVHLQFDAFRCGIFFFDKHQLPTPVFSMHVCRQFWLSFNPFATGLSSLCH